MNTLLLLVLLALLGGPHALHTGARDPSIRENLVAAAGVRSGRRWQLGAAGGGHGRAPSSPGCTLSRASTPTSTRQVNGDWFSIAQASDEPKLLRKDADMFLVHKIHISLKTIEFRAEGARRRQGPGEPHALSPVGLTATSQTLEDAGHNTIFLEEVDPSHFLIFCIHNSWHGKETVAVNVLGETPTVSWDIMQIFQNYCKSPRISPTNIINLTRTDRCLRARQQAGPWAQVSDL
ncbi:uterocalin-like [Ursus maritimus]|uniref:Uterocalin-like n=1 Tax=Ursus maritimus TaxID=29073 RepID=A0A8M1G4X1_URSMA|nr:uterocalin-like [Ursus maritimus]